jgi:hypothetical protein
MSLPSKRTEFRIISYVNKHGKTMYAIQERHQFPSFGRWWWHFVWGDYKDRYEYDTIEEARRIVRLWKTPEIRNVQVADENPAMPPKKMWGV